MNYAHKRANPVARTGGGGLVLEDTEKVLSLRAEIPKSSAGDDVLSLVRARVLRGLSVEFSAIQERMVAGVREISKAMLHAVGIVDSPPMNPQQSRPGGKTTTNGRSANGLRS